MNMSEERAPAVQISDGLVDVLRWGARALWGGVMALLLMQVAHTVLDLAGSWEYSTIRLQRSFVLAAGEPLFAAPGEGAILNTIYGPIAPLVFLPATLFAAPSTSVLAGSVLALIWFFGPAGLLLVRCGGRWGAAVGLPLMVAVALDVWPLTYAGFTVHVDGPALGLGLLACMAVIPGEGGSERRSFALASIAAVLAVWTKQVMAPLPVAMVVYVGWAMGWRSACRLVGWLLVVGSGVGLLVVALFGPLSSLWLYLVVVPGGHGWRWAEVAQWTSTFRLLLVEAASVWAVVLLVCAARLKSARRQTENRRSLAYPRLLALVAVVLLPMAVLGRIKVGGDANAFSYVLYFVLVGGLAGLVATARSTVPSEGRRLARSGSMVLLTGLVLVLTVFQAPPSSWRWRQALNLAQWPQEWALAYAKTHPDIYFPRLSMVHYLAHGDIVHQGVGLLDLFLAGIDIDHEMIADRLPRPLAGVAFQDNGFQGDIAYMPILWAFTEMTRDEALPGFVIFRKPAGAEP